MHESYRDQFIAACQQDTVVHFAGHGGAAECDNCCGSSCPDPCPNPEHTHRPPCTNSNHPGYRPYRLVLQQDDPDSSVVAPDITSGMMSGVKLVMLSTCHQLECIQGSVGLGYTMHDVGGAQCVIGYDGYGALIADAGLTWVDAHLWQELATGTCYDPTTGLCSPMWASQAVTKVQQDWIATWVDGCVPPLDPYVWNVTRLTCVGNTCLQPAF